MKSGPIEKHAFENSRTQSDRPPSAQSRTARPPALEGRVGPIFIHLGTARPSLALRFFDSHAEVITMKT